jgi:hypothetical protein
MSKHSTTAFEVKDKPKGNSRSAQGARLRSYLRRHTVGRWMAARATRIPLQTVCWIIGDLRKAQAVAVVRKSRCAISGQWVEYLTTDPAQFPKSNQLTLPLQ